MTITQNTQPLLNNPSATSLSIPPEDKKAELKHRQQITKVIAKRSFCTLATTSPAGRPHVAGVIYVYAEGSLWIHTLRSSRKARSIDINGFAAATIPFRRMPAGPPFTIHFQADAAVLAMDARDSNMGDAGACGQRRLGWRIARPSRGRCDRCDSSVARRGLDRRIARNKGKHVALCTLGQVSGTPRSITGPIRRAMADGDRCRPTPTFP